MKTEGYSGMEELARAQELIEKIEAAARGAGEIMLSASDIARKTSEKEGHGNFVTEYDRRVQAYLFRELERILPQAHFVGEEEGEECFREEYRSGYTFVIDPIDGTANFLSGVRPSVTSIALLKDGAPWIGVIYNPYHQLMLHALRGQGAFCNGERIFSSENDLAHSMVLFGTAPYYEGLQDLTFALARRYMTLGMDIRRSGAAAWDLCQMALGVAGVFYELRLGLWDFAAGALIAGEAGCVLTDPEGNQLRFDGPSGLVAASAGVAREGNYLPAQVLGLSVKYNEN
ncbi:MAG: inositol monophosphatase family protein [Stomatobaculum sp.]